ncbi:MAG: DUF308 domain-containing protein [Niabella sp.]
MKRTNNEDYKQRRQRQVASIRSILDYGIGALIIGIGGVILQKYKGDTSTTIFGVLAIIYGIWRLYKGFKKSKGG